MGSRCIVVLFTLFLIVPSLRAAETLSGPYRYGPDGPLHRALISGEIAVARSTGGTLLAIWTAGEVRGTRLRPDGGALDVPNLVIGATWSAAQSVDLVPLDSGFLAVWSTKLGVHTTVLDENGVVISGTLLPDSDLAQAVAIDWNGSEALVVWRRRAELHAATLDRNGYKVERISLGQGDRPDVTWNGANWVVAYAVDQEGAGSTLELTTVTRNLTTASPRKLWNVPDAHVQPVLSSRADGSVLVMSSGASLRWAVLSPDGVELSAEHEISGTVSRSAHAVDVPDGWIIVWAAREDSIHLGRLDQSGTLFAASEPVHQAPARPAPRLVGDGEDLLLVHSGEWRDLRGVLLARAIDRDSLDVGGAFMIAWSEPSVDHLLVEGLGYGYVFVWHEGRMRTYVALMDERGNVGSVRALPIELNTESRLERAGDRLLVTGLRDGTPLALIVDLTGYLMHQIELPRLPASIASDGDRFLMAQPTDDHTISFTWMHRDGSLEEAPLRLSAPQRGVGAPWMAWTGSHWLLAWVEHARFGSRYGGGPIVSGTFDSEMRQQLSRRQILSGDDHWDVRGAWNGEVAWVTAWIGGAEGGDPTMRLDGQGNLIGEPFLLPGTYHHPIIATKGSFYHLWMEEDLYLDRRSSDATLEERRVLESESDFDLRLAHSGVSVLAGGIERYRYLPEAHPWTRGRIAFWKLGEHSRRRGVVRPR